jgi:5-aminolevulinate synthase
MGGYIAANATIIDAVRSFAPGFIFTTSIAPAIAAGATAAIRHLKASSLERQLQSRHAKLLMASLKARGLPVTETESHIVPLIVGDPVKCKALTDRLLSDFSIYVQPRRRIRASAVSNSSQKTMFRLNRIAWVAM